MSLRYAILGLLSFEPMSGYTLKTRYFDGSVAYFWPADQAQIYRTLQALQADGLVESETVTGETRPDSRVYRMTDAGLAGLRDWLGEGRPIVTHKDAFLVQLYFARLLTPAQLMRVLRVRRSEHQALQRHLDQVQIPPGQTPDMRRQVRFGALVLDYGRRRERMMLDWLDATIEAVSEWPEDPG
ncbi:MAG: PadR family transcriptional regulator [Paracoccus sp. (in: a-proteobacteria)]